MEFKREERYEFKYEANGEVKACYPRSKEKVEESRRICEERGFKVIKVAKLYPFSTVKNQHNFDLVHSACMCRLTELQNGEPEKYEGEYEYLMELDKMAQNFFCLPLPVAWLPWEMHVKATQVAEIAIVHRQNVCEEHEKREVAKRRPHKKRKGGGFRYFCLFR